MIMSALYQHVLDFIVRQQSVGRHVARLTVGRHVARLIIMNLSHPLMTRYQRRSSRCQCSSLWFDTT
jgi:hypothetical protein